MHQEGILMGSYVGPILVVVGFVASTSLAFWFYGYLGRSKLQFEPSEYQRFPRGSVIGTLVVGTLILAGSAVLFVAIGSFADGWGLLMPAALGLFFLLLGVRGISYRLRVTGEGLEIFDPFRGEFFIRPSDIKYTRWQLGQGVASYRVVLEDGRKLTVSTSTFNLGYFAGVFESKMKRKSET